MTWAIACVAVSAGPGRATGLDDWLAKQVASTASKSTPKQTQSISIDQGSTTLVDQSSATDLVSTAFSLLPVSSNSANGQSGSGTVTTSLYAIYALATKQDPLTPTVYTASNSVLMRTLSFTLGREQQNSTGSSATSSATSATTPAGTVYGLQWTPWNRRDATRIAKDDSVMRSLASDLTAMGVAYATAEGALNTALCDRDTACENSLDSPDKVDAKIKSLSKDKQAQVQKAVADFQAALRNAYPDAKINALVEQLKHRFQFAINFQAIQRSGTAPNDYRGELIYDQGFASGWLLTLNGSYGYSDSPMIGADLRTGRGAMQLTYDIAQVANAHLRTPWQFNLSGEGLWQQTHWHYEAQLQLVIPITTGVDLPISFGYADQIDVLRQLEKGVYGKFGLTFDLGKVADSIKGLK